MSEQLASWIGSEHSALCIVDVQYDFASDNGCGMEFNTNPQAVKVAIDNIKRLYQSARENRFPVYFIGLKTSPGSDSEAWKTFMTRKGFDPEKLYSICRENTLGCDFYEVLPQPGDQIIYKAKYSAFVETDFAEKLAEKKINTLLICGLTTECCVDSTVRDAYHRDFSVFIVGDACAAYRQDYHDMSLAILEESFAINVATNDVITSFHTQGQGAKND